MSLHPLNLLKHWATWAAAGSCVAIGILLAAPTKPAAQTPALHLDQPIQLCQAVEPVPAPSPTPYRGPIPPAAGVAGLAPPQLGPITYGYAAPCEGGACQRPICGVDCLSGTGCGEPHWNAWGPIPWQAFAQGEYAGPARLPHVNEYRVRTDDEIDFIYRLTREDLARPYQMEVGDSLKIESLIDPALNRELTVQADGTIDLLLLGEVRVARRTVQEIRDDLNEKYKKYYKVTDINVTRVKTQTRLDDLRAAVDARFGFGGQGKRVRVTPDGTISLPAIGVVPATGLTLDELKIEVDERYRDYVQGMGLTPILAIRAPRYIFVLGEVQRPGRFDLTGPTTAMQAIALAGGWVNGGNLRQVVVFRRAEDWRLLATKLDIRGALYGERPQPSDEIWLRDSDVVVVPKTSLRRFDDISELVFTHGLYRVFPVSFGAQLINTGGVIAAPVTTGP